MTGPAITSRGKRTDTLWAAYKLRWNRRKLLVRSWWKGRQLAAVRDLTTNIAPTDILCFSCVRNEASRLPFWLDHHRKLGVQHFLIVANDCTDDTIPYLSQQPDVSLWQTDAGYRKSRFGMDWLGALMMRHGDGHWCLTTDADELLIYPHYDTQPLSELTDWLDGQRHVSFGAMLLDMYPKGKLADQTYKAGDDPIRTLGWFDEAPYWVQRQPKLQNLWLQGGPRARMFFDDTPDQAPTLNKVPLVRWSRRFSYVSSMHTLLPRHLNRTYDEAGDPRPTGVLLHTKFLDQIVDKSAEELRRQEHFGQPEHYDAYYQALIANPDLWTEGSCAWSGWRDLVDRGLMQAAGWGDQSSK